MKLLPRQLRRLADHLDPPPPSRLDYDDEVDALHMDLPDRCHIHTPWGFPAGKTWATATTIWQEGSNRCSVEEPLSGRTIPVTLPDDFAGEFEIVLRATDGTLQLAAEGRRMPPLTQG